MVRYRSRSRSLSESPPRRYSRSPPRRYSRSPPPRRRYDDPRERYRGGGGGGGGRGFRDRRGPPSGLLVRNIALDARPEDLRIPFERFGPVKDVYLPKNYYTGEPRGFGFVKFRSPDDAAEAKEHMNHKVIGGREISIVFAEENRKAPQEMRMTARISDRYAGGHRRRSPPRSPRRRHRSYSPSRSPPPRRESRERDIVREDCYSPRRSISRSPRNDRGHKSPRRSPADDRGHRSPRRSPSAERSDRSPSRSRSYSPR